MGPGSRCLGRNGCSSGGTRACRTAGLRAHHGGQRASGLFRPGDRGALRGVSSGGHRGRRRRCCRLSRCSSERKGGGSRGQRRGSHGKRRGFPDPAGRDGTVVRRHSQARGEKGISPAAKPPRELTAHLASVSRNSAGREVFTLDNGQVWRQSETRARFEAHAGDAVKIAPGGMGSFWLSTDVHNQTRVVRVITP